MCLGSVHVIEGQVRIDLWILLIVHVKDPDNLGREPSAVLHFTCQAEISLELFGMNGEVEEVDRQWD